MVPGGQRSSLEEDYSLRVSRCPPSQRRRLGNPTRKVNRLWLRKRIVKTRAARRAARVLGLAACMAPELNTCFENKNYFENTVARSGISFVLNNSSTLKGTRWIR